MFSSLVYIFLYLQWHATLSTDCKPSSLLHFFSVLLHETSPMHSHPTLASPKLPHETETWQLSPPGSHSWLHFQHTIDLCMSPAHNAAKTGSRTNKKNKLQWVSQNSPNSQVFLFETTFSTGEPTPLYCQRFQLLRAVCCLTHNVGN